MKRLILRFSFSLLFLCGIFLTLSCSIQSSVQTRTTTNTMYKNLKNINRGENLVFHFNLDSNKNVLNQATNIKNAKQHSINNENLLLKTNQAHQIDSKKSHN